MKYQIPLEVIHRDFLFMTKNLSKEQTEKLIEALWDASEMSLDYQQERHVLTIGSNSYHLADLRLPLSIHFKEQRPSNYLLLLIQTGHAAIGYFEGGENKAHKVFKSYLVRKKQGISQLKYLKTKGKSKAGSRVRLGNAVDFFEN
ncbi:MAG: hypothetical protein AAGC88_14000, partial [Bacteroidota bacterium]